MDELYDRIGQLGSRCTATLVGASQSEYFYITAAHCIFSNSSGNYLRPQFFPRRDWCKDKNGRPLKNCDTSPFGVWESGQGLTYQYFVNNCRTGSWTKECVSQDIAIVRVDRPAGQAFPGALGFGSYSNSYIKDRTSYLRSYPGCGGVSDPDAPGRLLM